jgi:radical SAM superfamily enzyme YgiQ (UPF0313 family)
VRVLLIYPPFELAQRTLYFPVGLAYVAAALRADGHAVRVVDMEGEGLTTAAAARRIAEAPADLVGFGGMITRYATVKELVPAVRAAHPGAFILAGNSGAATVPHLYLHAAGVDACCLGEGEPTATALARALDGGGDWRATPGLAFRDGDGVRISGPAPRLAELDALPRPAWELFPMERYVTSPDHRRPGARTLDCVASRGCPFECTFCYRIYGRRVTRRSPADVLAELVEIRDRFRLTFTGFRDDLLLTHRSWLEELCRLMLDARFRVPWSCLGRVDLVDAELLRLLREAGCVWISYGVESGAPAILGEMKKQLEPAQAAEALRLTTAAGIHADASFMLGMPGETPATAAATVRLCRDADVTATFNFVTPYPGSELYEGAKARGLIGDEEAYVSRLGTATDLVVNLTALPDDELRRLKRYAEREIFATYLRRRPLARGFAAARRVVADHGLGGALRRLVRTVFPS